MNKLPAHLQRYIVNQDDRAYTSVDQAVWRFCLRQLRSFLSKHAHPAYLSGLVSTGIEIESIPRIEEISKKISAFGWRALPVSGFIPPAAFMELQALSVLPIASDIRSLDHLLYTPAPDIVHEAAGHAPLLAHPEYAAYLKLYSQVASKAIISSEDLEVYKAIRILSDLKENPDSSEEVIKAAEKHLEKVSNVSHVSEATWLSRMNWWTAEYGLIGSLENPKIFGAGLLSSVGESRWCLSDKVKKLPLTVDCIHQTYDITEPQPQLFVAKDFDSLNHVLEDLADKMAFRIGGVVSVRKAIEAKTVNTIQFDSGIQISGQCVEVLTDDDGHAAYLRFQGPTQLSFKNKEIPHQGTSHHREGFGTPVGAFRATPSLLSRPGAEITLQFDSGVKVTGTLKGLTTLESIPLIATLTNARAEYKGRVLFEPAWGDYDIALGSSIPSVFGGPADHIAYGEMENFVASRIPAPRYSDKELRRQDCYQKIRSLRESKGNGSALAGALNDLTQTARKDFRDDWLLWLEMYEIALARCPNEKITTELKTEMSGLMERLPQKADVIKDGLSLAAEL